jgi:hypothetical protein
MAGKPLDGCCSRSVEQQRLHGGAALVVLLTSEHEFGAT